MRLSDAADVLFATYDPAIQNHKYSSPNKIFEAMMLGKPVIVAAGTNMDRIIETQDCGCVVPYGDVASLEKTMQTLADDPALLQTLGNNARKAYEAHYAWTIMQQRLLTLYHEVQNS
jgi:glycosyltransferase involved in cell wall biosynthesis